MSGRQFVVIQGKRQSDGELAPVLVDDDGRLVTAGTPSRNPLVATITLTGTAVELSTAAGDGAEQSQAAWRLKVPAGGADVLWGAEGSEVLQIDAGSDDVIPSATLAEWWAKSNGADVAVTLIGAQDV